MKVFKLDSFHDADLVVDAIYEGGTTRNKSGEPISKLLPGTGNMGGFRIAGKGENKKWIVFYTTGEDKDWPDFLDIYTGKFIYYGDNKKPGYELHDTPKGGNLLLKNYFSSIHQALFDRKNIPPIFVFRKYNLNDGFSSVQFKGLAVPGYMGMTTTEDLVAIWKTTNGQRFQNYKAVFTILDISVINRAWLEDLKNNKFNTDNAPKIWRDWINHGIYKPLVSEPTTIIRSLDNQRPDTKHKKDILILIWKHFRDTPISFESFAAYIYQLSTKDKAIIDEMTQGTVDGGRDAIGRYLIGLNSDPIYLDFYLEAKCYSPQNTETKENTVGVKEVSRLISRIRNRQFGVLITTSVIARQAYQEVREDKHPIIFITGGDIVNILIESGYSCLDTVKELLNTQFKKIEY